MSTQRHARVVPGHRQLGIDLGTTNTVVAIEGIPQELAIESGRTTLPSVLSFLANGETRIGTAAKRRRSVDPKNTLFSAKRIIGRDLEDPETTEFGERYKFELCAGEDGGARFVTRAGPISPTDVAAIILANLVGQLTHDLDGIEETVITVPPGFSASQRDNTILAAEKAGLPAVRLLDEPIAAAEAYTHTCNAVGRAGIYDLGGGTFDFSVVEWRDGAPELIASESDLSTGGDDVDHLLAEWVVEQVLARHNWDLRGYSEVYMRLLAECERAKIRLCFFPETTLDLGQVDPDCPVPFEGFTMTREDLDPLAESIARRTFAACDATLRQASIRSDELDAIFLVGGSTHLAKVRESIESYFGMAGSYDLEPTEAVAIGASLTGVPVEG